MENQSTGIPSMRVAVIGGGVAGIVAAHILQRRHDVTLFDQNDYLGGHTHTIVLTEGPDAGAAVDTGFIVLNDHTYPTFHRFLAQLKVPVRFADMSFGFHSEPDNLQYAGTSLNGLFAQRINLLRPAFWRMLLDIRRFCQTACRDLREGRLMDITLGDYIRRGGYSRAFIEDYLLPMGGAIWSAASEKMLEFPAAALIRFFENHGLLSLKNRPRWQTVVNGSHTYVRKFLECFRGTVHLACPVLGVGREEDGVQVRLRDGSVQHFDKAVIAAHADQALRMLEDPSPEEKRLLGAWSYSLNHTLLHTDPRVMPPIQRAWASWNYTRERASGSETPVSVTYHMNRLQGLTTQRDYFVTLNRHQAVTKNHILQEMEYTHPQFTTASMATQSELPLLNGPRHTYFCGSYFGYGFHEDAVKSGAAVARAFGLEL